MARVAQLGCALCARNGYEGTPAEVHHVRCGQGKGQHNDWLVIPLCPEHHRGSHGLHGDRLSFRLKGVDELMLLGDVICRLMAGPG